MHGYFLSQCSNGLVANDEVVIEINLGGMNMRWHDFDRNGRIDGRDYYLMNELLKTGEENEDSMYNDEDNDSESDDDLW